MTETNYTYYRLEAVKTYNVLTRRIDSHYMKRQDRYELVKDGTAFDPLAKSEDRFVDDCKELINQREREIRMLRAALVGIAETPDKP